MEYIVKTSLEKITADCIIIGCHDNKLTSDGEKLDKLSKGYISKIIKQGHLGASRGSHLLLPEVPGSNACFLIIQLGKNKSLSRGKYLELLTASYRAINNTPAKQVLFLLTSIEVLDADIDWKIRQAIEIHNQCNYSFQQFKSNPESQTKSRKIIFVVDKKEQAIAEEAVKTGIAIADAKSFTKDLANTPPNICTPQFLAQQAINLSKRHKKINVAVLNEKDLKQLKMHTLLAVAQGSNNPPRFITLQYKGGSTKDAPFVLVGKGVTFDTGGNSLKAPLNMIGMKFDMCGAASVLGAMQAASALSLPINIIGLIAAVENMPGASACRPEDVVTSMAGITVEILNTDAEGRLILADALTYAERFKPQAVIDIATLTGACLVALGKIATGLMSNDHKLALDLLQAGEKAYDRAWQLPLWEEYGEALKSPVADLQNISGGGDAGTIVGAAFLANFAKKYRWAHLDIAGTSNIGGISKERGATGRPVGLLVQYLIDAANHAR